MTDPSGTELRVILVTGPAGAGRSTAINAMEDLGFEAIDNLPIALVPRLLEGADPKRPLALGLDCRSRQFSPDALIDLHGRLAAQEGVTVDLLYLDCARDVLLRRFSETRRRHPVSPEGATADGVDRERAMLEPVLRRADILLDTTDLTPHDLRAKVQDLFAPGRGGHLAISLMSFSYKRGLPHSADLVLDCRFLDNPYWVPELRGLTGLAPAVRDHVAADPRFAEFARHVRGLIAFLLPAFRDEGKAHLSIAFGCTGGQHRSVAMTEWTAQALAEDGWQVSTRHRELERRGLVPVTGSGGNGMEKP